MRSSTTAQMAERILALAQCIRGTWDDTSQAKDLHSHDFLQELQGRLSSAMHCFQHQEMLCSSTRRTHPEFASCLAPCTIHAAVPQKS